MPRRPVVVLSITLAALAIGCVYLMLALARDPSERELAPLLVRAPQSAPGDRAPGDRATDPAESEFVLDDAEAESERTVAAAPESRHAIQAGATHWLDGHVILPVGTPADESVTVIVESHGRPRRAHRAVVEPDGRFHVQFPKGASPAYLRLQARYVYLVGEVVAVPASYRPADLELRPVLGGTLRARFVLPAHETARRAELVGSQVNLWSKSREAEPADPIESAEEEGRAPDASRVHRETRGLGDDLVLEFYRLPPDLVYQVEGRFPFACSSLDIEVRAGRVTEVDIEAALGVSIRGRVVDELGEPVLGANVVASVVQPDGSSPPRTRWTARAGADGSFDCRGIVPGDITLDATYAGRFPAQWKSGALAEGAEIDDVTLVLTRGNLIRGYVDWPADVPRQPCTVVARVRVDGESGQAPRTRRLTSAAVSDDGSFEIGGLGTEPVDLTVTVQFRAPRVESPADGAASPELDTRTSARGETRRAQRRGGRSTYLVARATAVEPGTMDVRLELRPPDSSASPPVIDRR